MNADETSVRARRYAEAMAVTAHASASTQERLWLDLLALMDLDDAARAAEAPAPTDAREALAEALAVVSELADEHTERLSDFEDGFAEGAREALRIIRAALSPTAPDAGQRDTQEQAESNYFDVLESITESPTVRAAIAKARAGREARP